MRLANRPSKRFDRRTHSASVPHRDRGERLPLYSRRQPSMTCRVSVRVANLAESQVAGSIPPMALPTQLASTPPRSAPPKSVASSRQISLPGWLILPEINLHRLPEIGEPLTSRALLRHFASRHRIVRDSVGTTASKLKVNEAISSFFGTGRAPRPTERRSCVIVGIPTVRRIALTF